MERREIEWFITLAETEHVTAAAAQLYISQPTLSRALARIEHHLGVQLFDRHQNRLRLNKYGEIFRAHAIRAMNEIALGEERVTSLVDPARGMVSVGFLHSFGWWLIPDLLNLYRREVSASTSFELHGGAADSVADDVRNGRIDMGFVAPQPVADDLEWIPLGREELGLGVPPGHRFEGHDEVTIADLEDEPMVALKVGYGLRHVMDQVFREADLNPRIEIEATELSTLRALVANGMGVALMPVSQRGFSPTIQTIPLSGSDTFRCYGAVVRHSGPAGHAARRFLEFVNSRSVAETASEPPRTGQLPTGVDGRNATKNRLQTDLVGPVSAAPAPYRGHVIRDLLHDLDTSVEGRVEQPREVVHRPTGHVV